MRTETLCNVIVCVSSVVFVLQGVGYLGPGWFLQELSVPKNASWIRADGRVFSILRTHALNAHSSNATGSQEQRSSNTNSDNNKNYNNDTPSNNNDGDNNSTNPETGMLKRPKSNKRPKREKSETDSDGNTGDERMKQPGKDYRGTGTKSPSKTSPGNQEAGMTPDPGDMTRGQRTPRPNTVAEGNQGPGEADTLDHDNMHSGSGMTRVLSRMSSLRDGEHILKISAGFWYGRACVSTSQSRERFDRAGMEWCTLYWRTDNRIPGQMKTVKMPMGSMSEMRIEASVGVGLSLLSVLIASTCCCHRHGTRAILSLVTMFLSGAAMAIPVIHTTMKHEHTKGRYIHDLLGHWPVLVSGAGSALALLSAIVLTVIKCRNPSTGSNKYDLDWSGENEGDDRKSNVRVSSQLPVHRLSHAKITLPPVTKSEAAEQGNEDDSESGYSDIKDDVTTSVGLFGSVHKIDLECESNRSLDDDKDDKEDTV